MASSDHPELVERIVREKSHAKEEKEENKEGEGEGGFLNTVKGFIHDIGEKIEGAIGFGKPTADVSGIHIPKINHKKVDFVVDVLVKNPNPVPIPLVDINYLIDSEGRKLISGLIPDAGTIHAHGSETIKIPVTLIFEDIKKTYSDIKPGSIIPYRIKVDLLIDVPVFGRITIPLEKTGKIPIPHKPDIDVEKIKFKKFSMEETIASLHLKLENMNDFDLGLKALDYEVWLGDVSIGGTELEKTANLEKNGITYLDLPVSFRPKDFGSAVWDMIRGRGTGYTMKGNIDVNTPFGDMKLPISKVGGTTRLKKKKSDGGSDEDEVKRRDNANANVVRASLAERGEYFSERPPTPLLDTINYPIHMKNFSIKELKQLADELRSDVIFNVSKTGGHLGSSLGVVELTVALHYVFNTPQDRILWDVGHQTYPHKILTGRRDKMSTLRQTDGLSGFTKRAESEYDAFGAGHSSNSISAALGNFF